jgi:hypothetical protein
MTLAVVLLPPGRLFPSAGLCHALNDAFPRLPVLIFGGNPEPGGWRKLRRDIAVCVDADPDGEGLLAFDADDNGGLGYWWDRGELVPVHRYLDDVGDPWPDEPDE